MDRCAKQCAICPDAFPGHQTALEPCGSAHRIPRVSTRCYNRAPSVSPVLAPLARPLGPRLRRTLGPRQVLAGGFLYRKTSHASHAQARGCHVRHVSRRYWCGKSADSARRTDGSYERREAYWANNLGSVGLSKASVNGQRVCVTPGCFFAATPERRPERD